MKKEMLIVFGIVLLFGLGNFLYAQPVVSLDEAISSGAMEIGDRLPQGTKVIVLNFQSSSQLFSNHVLDSLMMELIKNGKVTVVDRENLDLIQQELKFQMSGEVSDESAQSIGKILGAQSIVSGRFEDLGANYRIIFRTIAVETAAIQALTSINVKKDSQTATLLGEESSANKNIKAFGYGAMNIALGLGSYLQGDIIGGIMITSVYGVSIGLIIWEVAGLKYEDTMAGIPGTIGLSLAGANLVFGFIKPFLYAKNPKVAFIMDGINFSLVSDERRDNALQLTYTHRY